MAKERKGLKLRRCAKHKSYYAVQYGKTDDNKLRRLRRHLREERHRNDAAGRALYLALGGKEGAP